jgi:hypothetical protein
MGDVYIKGTNALNYGVAWGHHRENPVGGTIVGSRGTSVRKKLRQPHPSAWKGSPLTSPRPRLWHPSQTRPGK